MKWLRYLCRQLAVRLVLRARQHRVLGGRAREVDVLARLALAKADVCRHQHTHPDQFRSAGAKGEQGSSCGGARGCELKL